MKVSVGHLIIEFAVIYQNQAIFCDFHFPCSVRQDIFQALERKLDFWLRFRIWGRLFCRFFSRLGNRRGNRFFDLGFFLDFGGRSGIGLDGLLVGKGWVERGDCSAEKVVLQAGYLLDYAGG